MEDQTGLYLRLNDDDDDSDTEIDNQDNKVIGEDDLVRLEISCEPGDLPGNFTLSWGNNIKLWERTEKETEITQSQYTSEQLPETCYVEGYNVSSTIKDTEIKLSYQAPDDTQAEDKAKITVWNIKFNDPVITQYIPRPETGNPYYIVEAQMNPPDAFDGKLYWTWQDPSPSNTGQNPQGGFFQQYIENGYIWNLNISDPNHPFSIPHPQTGVVKCKFYLPNGAGDDGKVVVSTQPNGKGEKAISGIITVVEVKIETQDCDEIQVQRVNTSSFIWEAIPFKITYDILPSSGWTPDEVILKIFDSSDNVVFAKNLSNFPGNNQIYNWDGKDNSGQLVIYGNYKAKIKVKKNNSTMETEEYQFTVYQINQGNTVYYDLDKGPIYNQHAGLIYSYTGGNTLSELQDDGNYKICEVQGPDSVVGTDRTLYQFKTYSIFRGIWTSSYLPNDIFQNRQTRAQIIRNATQLIGKPYVRKVEVHDVLIPNGTLDGTIDDILRLRCDGVPEVSYENSADRLFGDDQRWNIMLNQENLDYHNHYCTPLNQMLQSIPSVLYLPYSQ
ncbi:MAG: hypothetical protein NC825_05810 [Candidatus Omnitrophica bacterium]|nr:hypothetical protein [Candidatus Omnitrophota bacterium]